MVDPIDIRDQALAWLPPVRDVKPRPAIYVPYCKRSRSMAISRRKARCILIANSFFVAVASFLML